MTSSLLLSTPCPPDEGDPIAGGFSGLMCSSDLPAFLWEFIQPNFPTTPPLNLLFEWCNGLLRVLDEQMFHVLCIRPDTGSPLEHMRLRFSRLHSGYDWPKWDEGSHTIISTRAPDEEDTLELWHLKQHWKRMVDPDKCSYDLNLLLDPSMKEAMDAALLEGMRAWLKTPHAPYAILYPQDNKKGYDATQWLAELSEDDFREVAYCPEQLRDKLHQDLLMECNMEPEYAHFGFYPPTDELIASRQAAFQAESMDKQTPSASSVRIRRV